MLRTAYALAALAAAAVSAGPGTARKFDFADPKGVSGMTVRLDSLLEPVSGHANGVAGVVELDPADPASARGSVTVRADSLTLGSADMTAAMRQDWGLDTARYPEFRFEVAKVSDVRALGEGRWSVKVEGGMTVKGVTRPVAVRADVAHLPRMLAERGGMPGKQGDLLVVRSRFSFDRTKFGIAPDLDSRVIGKTVEVELAFVAVSPD